MAHTPRNISASARQRLLNLSKALRIDYNQLLNRYAIERFLYRLSSSRHRDSFVLKGATLFAVWNAAPHRPTRDLDLLCFGDRSLDRMVFIFREICATPVADDGWTFEAATVTAENIRSAAEYGGVRVHFTGKLGGALLRIQTDIGFGDAITPAANNELYPSLLGMPTPVLRTYPRQTVVAEKLEAIVKLGMLNTRQKDYYDLLYLAREFEFDGEQLARAICATFVRRGTTLPFGIPVGLTATFGLDTIKRAQWVAYCRRLGENELPAFRDVVAEVEAFAYLPMRGSAIRTIYI